MGQSPRSSPLVGADVDADGFHRDIVTVINERRTDPTHAASPERTTGNE